MTIPNDPFEHIPGGLQDFFWNVPGADHIPSDQVGFAETMFAVGFGFHSEDYDNMGIDPDAVTEARREYFDFMGLLWEDFDWAGWREEMGYDEA